MKNQCRGKYIYVYPVLLIVLEIIVNGCATVPTIQAHNIVVPPHKFSSLEVNI